MTKESHRERSRLAWYGLVAGPASFLIMLLLPAGSMGESAHRVLATILWMAVWWLTEAVPIAVTSLLPLVLFPLLGVEGIKKVAPRYGDHMVFLFLGGFVLALAIERSGLHRRFALRILRALGDSRRRILWGFLVVTALLSMWLSNTATTLMMLPIAAAVVGKLDDDVTAERVFLAVAYGASIGGLGTIIGTPPNVVLVGLAPKLVPSLPPISFGGWMLFGIPMVMVLLPTAGFILARGLPAGRGQGAREVIDREWKELGPMSHAEKRAAALFGITVLLWITRSIKLGNIGGWSHLLSNPKLVTDAVPAIGAAIATTLIPSGDDTQKRPLLTWSEIVQGVPWGVLILFGGGFALAKAVTVSHLDKWLGNHLQFVSALPAPLVVLTIAAVATTATELTSNTAMATLLIPVMAALAETVHFSPYVLMITATVACSYAFMLPVATPPNAIVMGSGKVRMSAMFREGIKLNIVSAVVLTVLVLTLGKMVFPHG